MCDPVGRCQNRFQILKSWPRHPGFSFTSSGISGVCSVLSHLEIGLLQIACGRSFPACHHTDPECSCPTSQSSPISLHCCVPPLDSFRCPIKFKAITLAYKARDTHHILRCTTTAPFPYESLQHGMIRLTIPQDTRKTRLFSVVELTSLDCLNI